MRRAKPGELKAGWSLKERDIQFSWGQGVERSDGRILFDAFCFSKGTLGTTLVNELEKRGYDITTLKFSIMKKVTGGGNNGTDNGNKNQT